MKTLVTEEVQLLAGALRMGGSHLSHNPDTLAFDLLGRLLHHYNDNSTLFKDEDNNNGADDDKDDRSIYRKSKSGACIKSLLQQCDSVSTRHSALLPMLHCFDPPSAMSLFILEGHSLVIETFAIQYLSQLIVVNSIFYLILCSLIQHSCHN